MWEENCECCYDWFEMTTEQRKSGKHFCDSCESIQALHPALFVWFMKVMEKRVETASDH